MAQLKTLRRLRGLTLLISFTALWVLLPVAEAAYHISGYSISPQSLALFEELDKAFQDWNSGKSATKDAVSSDSMAEKTETVASSSTLGKLPPPRQQSAPQKSGASTAARGPDLVGAKTQASETADAPPANVRTHDDLPMTRQAIREARAASGMTDQPEPPSSKPKITDVKSSSLQLPSKSTRYWSEFYPESRGVPERRLEWWTGQFAKEAKCGNNYQNIVATEFAGNGTVGSADSNHSKFSAYSGKKIDPASCTCALPYRFPHRIVNQGKSDEYVLHTLPVLRIKHKKDDGTYASTICVVNDIGPHYNGKPDTTDPYWQEEGSCRPDREDVAKRNKAGIDLTPGCFKNLGAEGAGKMKVDWSFI